MAVPEVVVVGAGFGGLNAIKALARAPVHITVIDRQNHHLFQPLLYQVATAALSESDIAVPIRALFAKEKNVRVQLASATSIDLDGKRIALHNQSELSYDYLILAAGSQNNYFGHGDWEPHAPGMKSIDDALEIRRRTLLAFERAEQTTDVEGRRRLLTFVVVGGGPAGVELAGALGELRRFVLRRDFRTIHPSHARVVLLQGGPRLLPAFAPELSAKAAKQLAALGVDVHLGTRVEEVDARGVKLEGSRIDAGTVVWTAGVQPSPLTRSLRVPLDRHGRVRVEKDLSIPGHPEAFVIGDAMYLEQAGAPLPGLSEVAMQGGKFAAHQIEASLKGRPRGTFHYFDMGIIATVGRSRAVAQTFGLKLSGFLAWLTWACVHLWYLVGFSNRLIVMIEWFWAYVANQRSARLITWGSSSLEAAKIDFAELEGHSDGRGPALSARTDGAGETREPPVAAPPPG